METKSTSMSLDRSFVGRGPEMMSDKPLSCPCCGETLNDERFIALEKKVKKLREGWQAMKRVLPKCPEYYFDGCPWHLMEDALSEGKD